MSPQSKKEYLETVYLRYKKASRRQKSLILDEVCSNCGYHRKHEATGSSAGITTHQFFQDIQKHHKTWLVWLKKTGFLSIYPYKIG